MADLNHDIEKYLRGELSSSEMHALEKKALDDPFLADALEGIESVSQTDVSDDIQQLKAAVQKRVKEDDEKVIPLWLLVGRIAAGLLVLVISGYVVLNLLSDDKHPDNLALNKPIAEPKATPAPTETPESKAESTVGSTPKEERLAERAKHSTITSRPANDDAPLSEPTLSKEDITSQAPEKEERVLDQEIVATNDYAKLDSTMVQKDVTTVEPVVEQGWVANDRKSKKAADTYGYSTPSAVQRSAVTKTENKRLPATVVHGTVRDENNEPLPGVNVMIKGSNNGVVTDVDGTYQIPLDDTNAELVFSFIGMNPVDVPVSNNEAIDIKMEEDVSQLSEVVVVGYASVQDGLDREKEPNIYQLAEPAGGRKAFKKYLVDNMRYPETAIENKIQGKVTIQFTVQQSGTVNDFKVIKGLGYGCDEEVIRLIRQGPKWTPTRRNAEPLRGKVKVRLRFQLPH